MAWSETMLIVQHFYNVFKIDERLKEMNFKFPLIAAKNDNGVPELPEDVSLEDLTPGTLWFIKDNNEDSVVQSLSILNDEYEFADPIPFSVDLRNVNVDTDTKQIMQSLGITADNYYDTIKLILNRVKLATQSANGLMSSIDKTKLDGIANNANNYVHPTTSGNKHIPSGGASGQILRWYADGTATWGNDNNTTYSVATQSANGLMSSTDKAKLDGIASGANVTPAGLSSGYVRTGQKSGTTIGDKATAEGENTTASAYCSHAEGYSTKATNGYSHAEGYGSTASGQRSHVEGNYATAQGNDSHAEGYYTTASGQYSHAEGYYTTASGQYSHAGGYYTIASGDCQTAIGECNTDTSAANGLFVIGNGTGYGARSNAFRVASDGTPYGKKAYNTSGADYAEYFEWEDGNQDNEDRRGYFVTMEGDKIKKASAKDSYILGVISGKPSVIGNSDPDDWHGHFLCDEFGNFIMQKVIEKRMEPHLIEVKEKYLDEEGNEAIRTVTTVIEQEVTKEIDSYILGPDYDPDKEYIPRSDRPEWAAVGMLGVLVVRDDGTCQVNSYCTVSDGGIATASNIGWRVIKRVRDDLIKIVFK